MSITLDEERYWMWQWLEEYRVTTPEKAREVLLDPNAIDHIARLARENKPVASAPKGEAVVAAWGLGRGLWRSHAVEIATQRADALLRQTWHYYDAVIVEDAVRHEVEHHWTDPLDVRRERLLGHVSILLHFRALGAEPLIRFRDKPKLCGTHWRAHVQEDHLPMLAAGADKLIAEVVNEANVQLLSKKGFRELMIGHSSLPEGHIHWRLNHRLSRRAQVRAAVDEALAMHISYLRADLLTGRRYDAPIGVADGRAMTILSGVDRSSPLFNLDLPILTGIPTATLLEVRRDAGDVFARFQTALRRAAKEAIAEQPEALSRKIARDIQADLIDPELRRIADVLSGARDVVARRSAAGVAIGLVAAGVGLLFGIPPVAAIAAAVGGGVTGATAGTGKYFETTDEVKRSDLYFLWKAASKGRK
jgi:hypothetical protein